MGRDLLIELESDRSVERGRRHGFSNSWKRGVLVRGMTLLDRVETVVGRSVQSSEEPLRYELAQSPEGMRIDPYNGELTWRPSANQAGEHPIVIEVSDSRGAKSTQEFVLPIVGPPGSAPAAPAP